MTKNSSPSLPLGLNRTWRKAGELNMTEQHNYLPSLLLGLNWKSLHIAINDAAIQNIKALYSAKPFA